ncbi:MAG: flagellar assembly peptidoglycan hydrolase FlgJ [Gammaproteobacteria bacterium]|nr:MAG: flagellar assembly peptidoglycan hydrolase FlgJ [Gammaproteobacteria bacterium]
MKIDQASFQASQSGLNALQGQVKNTDQAELEKVAAQFESVFVQMMVKSMRDATIKSDFLQSNGIDTYQQMFDQQISIDLSQSGGLGLAQILVEQMSPQGGATEKTDSGASSHSLAREQQAMPLGSAARLRVNTVPVDPPLAAAASTATKGSEPLAQSPEEFVRKVWDGAVAAAQQLNVAPEVLVAQSALETGWGQQVIAKADGASSFNLFGIKADSRWQGDSATVSTLEYRDGIANREQAAFRAYDSLEQTFSDYVEFLQSSPRYGDALSQSVDSRAFLQGLQDAGYATDPNYADKIMAILDGDRLNAVVDELKFSPQMSIGS